jgi:tRNA-binding protein
LESLEFGCFLWIHLVSFSFNHYGENMITYDDFAKVEIRVGTVVSVEEFPEARKPALKLFIDFGPEIGSKKTSAQITHLYNKDNLVGKQVIAVVNFPPKQVGSFKSEVLVLGLSNDKNEIVLVHPGLKVDNGQKLH